MFKINAKILEVSSIGIFLSICTALFTPKSHALTCGFVGLSINRCNYGAGGPDIFPPRYERWFETNQNIPPLSYKPTDKDVWFINGPQGDGLIEWLWNDKNNSGNWLIPPDPRALDEWIINVEFTNFSLFGSTFEYVVIIDKGQGGSPHNPWNDWFEDVELKSDLTPAPPKPPDELVIEPSVTKTIWSAICTSPTSGGRFNSCVKGDLLGKLNNNQKLTLPSGHDKLYIRDAAIKGDGNVLSYTNIFRQTPGPLSILGACTAFRFTRKLRKRINQSRRC